VAEAVLDATLSVVVGVDWSITDESLVEVSWLETVLLCESVAVLDATETLLELEMMVWEASELDARVTLWLETESEDEMLLEDIPASVEED